VALLLRLLERVLLSRNNLPFFLLAQEPAYLMQVKWNQISKGDKEQFENSGSSRKRGENYSVRLTGGKKPLVRGSKNRGFDNSTFHYTKRLRGRTQSLDCTVFTGFQDRLVYIELI